MAAASGSYTLEIASGLYRGVSLELGEGRHVVGGEDADVVLLEETIKPAHAAIVLDRDTIRVEGLAEDVVVESAGPVPPGSARTVLLPAAIRIGDVTTVWRLTTTPSAGQALAAHPAIAKLRHSLQRDVLPKTALMQERVRRDLLLRAFAVAMTAWRVCSPHLNKLQRSIAPGMRAVNLQSKLRHPAVLGSAAAVILLGTVFWSILNGNGAATALVGRLPESSRPDVTRMTGRLPEPVVSGERTSKSERTRLAAADGGELALGVPGPDPRTERAAPSISGTPRNRPASNAAAAAAATLRSDVEQAGLLNVVIGAAGGTVTASGTVEPAMAPRWQAAQEGFDERHSGEITLVNSVAVRAEKLPPSLGIEGVWRGDRPYIVVRGQRYLVGAVLDGGWAIRSIEQDRVMLEREGRLVAMRF